MAGDAFQLNVTFKVGAMQKRLWVESLPHAGMDYNLANGSGLVAKVEAVIPDGTLGFIAHLKGEVDPQFLLEHGWTSNR